MEKLFAKLFLQMAPILLLLMMTAPPEFEREAVPGGDDAEDSVDMNFCGYDTQLIGLEGGCKLKITWPPQMNEDARQELVDAWEEEAHEGWESAGWDLDDTEVWFWDDLNIELVQSSGVQNTSADSGPAEGWTLNTTQPPTPGIYAVETVEKAVWPNFPITEANWSGTEWLDEDGEPLKIHAWKEPS